MLKILVACERSQMVTRAFRRQGHAAYSCDTESCLGQHPEWHIQQDVSLYLLMRWDMIIAFPPCTHLAVAGARWFKQKRADGRQQAAIEFFMRFTKLRCPRVAIENPKSIMSSVWRKPDQIIQPWQYGHGETKGTHLWLKGLPLLQPTEIVNGRVPRVALQAERKNRAERRSRTYAGIAQAMALQWTGEYGLARQSIY